MAAVRLLRSGQGLLLKWALATKRVILPKSQLADFTN
jgi:hypothetical protein